MNIYTKTGDSGTTSLLGGKRVKKNCIEMQAIGEVDELNAGIGLILTEALDETSRARLVSVQNHLFTIGSELAAAQTELSNIPHIKEEDVVGLETWIDGMQLELTALRQFILPGGTRSAALAFHVRAICRRAERHVVALNAGVELNPSLVMYLNRLSDALFVLGRYLNKAAGKEETVWEK